MFAGIEVAVDYGAITSIIDHRMQSIKITHYFKGQVNKQVAFDTLKSRLNLSAEEFGLYRR